MKKLTVALRNSVIAPTKQKAAERAERAPVIKQGTQVREWSLCTNELTI